MDNEEEKDLANKYPSLQLAYEQVKGALVGQEQCANRLDTKAGILIAVATSVIGIGMPLGITRLSYDVLWLLAILVVPVSLYVYALYCFWQEYRLRQFEAVENAETVEDYFDLSPDEFMMEVLNQTKESFGDNDKKLKEKAQNFEHLLFAMIGQTISVILWVSLAFGFTI